MSLAPTSFLQARWFRFGIIGVVAVFLITALLAYTLIDTRKVASVASSAVQKMTGRTLTINGPVSLKLFPHLSIVAEDVSLGNATWASDPVMVKAKEVSLNLDWMPLWHQQISINEVDLSVVTLNLQSAPAGQKVSGNWDLLTSTGPASSDTSSTEAFNLHVIKLENVTVNLRDDKGALTQSVVVDQMTGGLNEMQVDFAGSIQWQKQAMALKGSLAYKPNVPLDLTLDVQSDKIDLKAALGVRH